MPLVTVTEGTISAGSRRNRTIEPMHFVDEKQSSKMLWKSVEGYMARAYDVEQIEKIYIHGDGGKWIQNGLETFSNVIHVMDGYHFFKELKAIARKFPERNVKVAIVNALAKDERKRADRFIQELAEEDVEILKFGKYLFGNWDQESDYTRHTGKLYRRTGKSCVVRAIQQEPDGMEQSGIRKAQQTESIQH